MRQFLERMLRAAKLDPEVYEEVEADRGALGQASGVVLLASIAGGVGSGAVGGAVGIVYGTLVELFGWLVWAALCVVIGTKLLPDVETRADFGELLRTLGFASAPGILRVAGLVPRLEEIVFLLTGVWMLAAMVVAVRQALDYRTTTRAVVVCGIGWIVQLVLRWLIPSLP